jgi:sterol desaturase/sphingolipid hydroxylase (fatty acid hydroxylase superfamily)
LTRLSESFWLYFSLLATVLVLTAVFYVLEECFPAERHQPASSRWFNTAYYIFIVAWLLLLQFVFAPVFSVVLIRAGGGFLPQLMNPPRGFFANLAFALAFAAAWDLWQYWVHRLQHAWPVFWQMHKFHHSDTALNASAQARHHLLNYVLHTALYLPLLLFWGSLTPHFVATFVMFTLWGFVNHANTRLDLGFLTPIISGPHWHRIHHSTSAEHYDKNFAAFFPVIDILFGTYYQPRRDEYPPTGIPAADFSGHLGEATIAPFVGLYWLGWHRIRKLTERVSRLRVSSTSIEP